MTTEPNNEQAQELSEKELEDISAGKMWIQRDDVALNRDATIVGSK